ncbi:hypothetical protein [Yoonia sp. R2-816]
MTDDDKPPKRHDPVSLVRPFARVRIMAAIVIFLIGLVVLAFRVFSG